MAEIKSMSAIVEKWTRVTPGRSEDYRLGVTNPTKDWKTKTLAAKEAHKAGIQKAIAEDRFAKGVNKSSTDIWRVKALSKGVNRFGEGVGLAGPDYDKGFAPYRAVIAGLTLPPRYAKGDPRNLARVKVIAEALHAKKVSG